MYTTDPNNAKKQVPKARSVDAYGRATQPGPQVLSDRPNYVLVNASGNYSFLYAQTGSFGGGDYISGSNIQAAGAGPIRLDIQPRAWASSGGATGDVTFVYTGDVG